MNQYIHYIHHAPGKLRIKNSLFKSKLSALDAVTKYFDNITGIEYVTTNPINANITVQYNPEIIHTNQMIQIVNYLHMMGKISNRIRRKISEIFCLELGL